MNKKSSTKETIRARKIKRARKGSKAKNNQVGRYMLKRKNCFGLVDQINLHRAEATEAINQELEAYLNEIAPVGSRRSTQRFKKITQEQEAERKASKETIRPPKKG